MTDELSTVDTVVLDLDGVLVDVSGSYRRAVKESVGIVYGKSPDDGIIQRLKNIGGFNNDWNVTYACALFVLAREESPGLTLQDWAGEVDAEGGGLSSAVRATETLLTEDQATVVMDRWAKKKLWKIFQELYLGSEGYGRIEDEQPVLERRGFIYEEPVLIEDQLIDRLSSGMNVGILTGRPRTEATMALERIEWELDPKALIAMEDWDHEKPSPEGLLQLATYFGSQEVLYAGDTLDDVRTAVNATGTDPDRTFHGVGVLTGGLTGEDGRRKFQDAGATEVLDSINQLPSLIDMDRAP